MTAVFLKLLDMSVNAVWLIMAVFLLRLIFTKAPKSWRSALWALVGFRLVFPFSIPNPLSPIPYVKPSSALTSSTTPVTAPSNPSSILNKVIISSETSELTENIVTDTAVSTFSLTEILSIAVPVIWLAGVFGMLLYAIISYVRLYKLTKESVPSEKGFRLCDKIDSPFILGIFKPKIFLPSDISNETITYVEAHELSHIKRLDHWRKIVAYIILSLHWFNPFVWVSYILFCRDTELACDEKATKNYEPTQKAGYTQALLYFTVPKNSLFICPFSFAESGIKNRIKSVLNYKKPAFWVILLSIIATVVVSILVFSNPAKPKTEKPEEFDLDYAVSQAIKDYNVSKYEDIDIVPTESHIIYGKVKNGNQITAYLEASYEGYIIDNPLGIVESFTGSWCPCAITFEINEDGSYKVLEYWEPEDGTYYASSIKSKFPPVYAFLALRGSIVPPLVDTSEVYEHFNAPKTVSFVSPDSGHLFCDEKGDATLTLNTETNDATLSVNGKEIFTDFYSFFNFDEDGDTVTEYIYLCDVDNLPNNRWEYDFTIIDENTLCVTNLPEKPVFTRVEE